MLKNRNVSLYDIKALQVFAADIFEGLIRTYSGDNYRLFKLIKGKNGTTVFLPLNTKIGGPVKYIKEKETICLTKDQARLIN